MLTMQLSICQAVQSVTRWQSMEVEYMRLIQLSIFQVVRSVKIMQKVLAVEYILILKILTMKQMLILKPSST